MNKLEEAFSITAVRRWQTEEFKVITWERVKEAAVTDDLCVRLNTMIRLGFPESRTEMDDDLRPFWPMREDMYTLEEVPMKDYQMYIPAELRGEVLDCLHSAHQGENNMKASARARFFWPSMGAAISQKRN